MSDETIAVPIETELDALFGQYPAAEQSRGLVYGLVGPEGLIHCAGFGVVDEDGSAPDEHTLFPIASMTKSFIAATALIARDRGLLSLEDPVTRFLPEYSASGSGEEPYDPPTLRMLLSMAGGLTEDNSWVDPFIDMPEESLLEIVHRGLRYSHLPGAVFEYSNLGFTLAGLAVARAVGQPLEDLVRDELLAPLGLAATCFDTEGIAGVRRATGYSLDQAGAWVPYPHTSSGAFAAAGGLLSTVADLASWVTWLGAAFRPPGDRDPGVLSRASRRELQRLHTPATPALALRSDGALRLGSGGYGLGLMVSSDLHRGTVVAHAGGLPGFTLFMCWHPASGHGVVVLTNSHRGDPITLATDALGRVLARHDAPAETVRLWPETVELRASVDRLIRSWDDDLAARVFAENVDFDRPLAQRRAEIERLVVEIGPLGEPRPPTEVVSAATPADVTWSLPGQRGELLCMIHLTPTSPARVQELVVRAVPAGQPRSASPVDISARRAWLGTASITPLRNNRVLLP